MNMSKKVEQFSSDSKHPGKKQTKVYKRREKYALNNNTNKKTFSQKAKQGELDRTKKNKIVLMTRKSTYLEKTFSNISNMSFLEESLMKGNESLLPHSKKLLKRIEEDKRKEKILKRIGFVGDGFVESLMMNTDKNFNVHKFLEINMYQILKGKKKESPELKLCGQKDPVFTRLARINEQRQCENDDFLADFSINEEIDNINKRYTKGISLIKNKFMEEEKTFNRKHLDMDFPLIQDRKLFDELSGTKKKPKSKKKKQKHLSEGAGILAGLKKKIFKIVDKQSLNIPNGFQNKNLLIKTNKSESFKLEGVHTASVRNPLCHRHPASTRFSENKNFSLDAFKKEEENKGVSPKRKKMELSQLKFKEKENLKIQKVDCKHRRCSRKFESNSLGASITVNLKK